MPNGSPLKNQLNEYQSNSRNKDKASRTSSAKPVTPYNRPELTRLPQLTFWRKVFRQLVNSISRLAVILCTRCQVNGLGNFPAYGPALVVTNHLGDADPVVAAALFPSQVDGLAKIDLVRDYPPLGWLMEAYGVIWVHRGRPDRRALRAGLQGLREGRIVAVAPEGRESLIGGLEPGTGGAAYLALKAGVPVVPVVFIGTENNRIFGSLRRLKRTKISMTIGAAFNLRLDSQTHGGYRSGSADHEDEQERAAPMSRGLISKQAIDQGTHTIMLELAKLLPPEYRGVYQKEIE
jgi:1-acyl-sn-glycerol-3-phosphate acyltransferase